jgi:uncharacterized protein involved in exopolysaccharide biosynthesis
MDRVSIADKVKFWQEQDRINKALIPRLLKTHELVVELSGQFSRITSQIATVEARLTKKSGDELGRITAELAETKSSIEEIESTLKELTGESQRELTGLRSQAAAIDAQLGLLQSRLESVKGRVDDLTSSAVPFNRADKDRYVLYLIAGLSLLSSGLALIMSSVR